MTSSVIEPAIIRLVAYWYATACPMIMTRKVKATDASDIVVYSKSEGCVLVEGRR
jgi:hypothetical protein